MQDKKNGLESLIVYQKSKKLAIETFKTIGNSKIPYKHEFVVNQLLRSVSSIGANIAEGYGRHYRKYYRQFLSISRGSCYESLYWFEIAKEVRLINNEVFTRFVLNLEEIVKMLTTMMKNLERK